MSKKLPSDEKERAIYEFIHEKGLQVLERDEQGRFKRVADSVVRENLFLDQFKEVVQQVFKKKLHYPRNRLPKNKLKTSRILNLLISDTHYGSSLDPREVGHKYGPVEEARRTAEVCRQVARYKHEYRKDTELHIHLLGDIIQNNLHDDRDGLPLAEQVAAAMRILVQAIAFLSKEFPKGVVVSCVTGNHGRNKGRHRTRAVNQKWDSIETMIYTALKELANFIPNVKVNLGYTPKYDFEAFGKVGFATHGDNVLNVGYPGKSINVESLHKQINKINNARVFKGHLPYSLFIVGHVHIGTMTHLPGGVKVITNGCLIPPDAYAENIGIFESTCGQWLWESIDGHMVGDARFIEVDELTDNNTALDKIIKPFEGL